MKKLKPKVRRKGWRWLRKGSIVREGDAYQWSALKHTTEAVDKCDIGHICRGKRLSYDGLRWSGYIRRIKK